MAKASSPLQKSFRGMGQIAPRPSTVPGYQRQDKERWEQVTLYNDFLDRFAYLEPRFRWVHASLNGAFLTPRQRMKAKAAGMRAGVWDLEIPYDGTWEGEQKSALHIEMKIPPNRLTEEQEAFRCALEEERAFVVATSWLVAARAIVSYLGVTHKTILEAVR